MNWERFTDPQTNLGATVWLVCWCLAIAGGTAAIYSLGAWLG